LIKVKKVTKGVYEVYQDGKRIGTAVRGIDAGSAAKWAAIFTRNGIEEIHPQYTKRGAVRQITRNARGSDTDDTAARGPGKVRRY